jgi:cyclohexadieny/prephenate dehydrogenase
MSTIRQRRSSCVSEPLFRRLALIGVGLIGSSIARIAQERGGLAAEVVVTARSPKTLDRVRELGFANRIELPPAPSPAPTA